MCPSNIRRDDYALENVSFDFNVGDRLGIVRKRFGENYNYEASIGGLYDADSGQILINGKDIKDYDVDELRSSFGVLFQDFNKYEITFRENVELSNINKNSKDDLAQSINRAGADSVLKNSAIIWKRIWAKFTMTALKFQVASGKELQPQELYHGGNVLIFDEPTSALDPIQEKFFGKIFWKTQI